MLQAQDQASEGRDHCQGQEEAHGPKGKDEATAMCGCVQEHSRV